VRAVCTVGSRCVWTDPAARSARRTKDAALAARIESEGMRAFVSDGTHGAHDDALAAAAPREGTHGLARALRGLGAADQPDVGAALAVSAVPLLLLAGASDAGPLAAAQALAADLPAASALAIVGAGHRAHLERTHEVARLALDFFAAAAGDAVSDLDSESRTRPAAAAGGERSW
jgi:2-succinyl-6-hydroxy-2,4-cyclohexadiene-1-carboxylate synthase